jgi:thioredoxin reductase (NADPH)
VTVVHRRDKFRAEKIMQDKLFARSNVRVRWNHELDAVLGDASGVTGMRIKPTQAAAGANVETGGEEIAVHGVFVAIGHTPNTTLFEGQLNMQGGYIVTQGGLKGFATQTSVPGVFAAGDVQDKTYRQAVTAAGTGCMAALEAEKFLAHAAADSPAMAAW